MKRAGSPNMFEKRLIKMICHRVEIVQSAEVRRLKKDIERYKTDISAIIHDYQLDCPTAEDMLICLFCKHILNEEEDDQDSSWCFGTQCPLDETKLPCGTCWENEYGADIPVNYCATETCGRKICPTCTICRDC